MDTNLAAEMYREHILELFKEPHNFGKIENKTHSYFGNNPLCGDEISLDLIIENDKIKEVKFNGQGCAISMASASLLTDKIKGMSTQQILNIKNDDVLELLKIPISHVRMKCATLSLDTLKKALIKTEEKYDNEIKKVRNIDNKLK